MKVGCVVAVALLVLAFCPQAQSQSFTLPTECCFGYSTKQIPANKIKDYKITHPNCRKKAVLLITLNNSKVCANPEAKHTKDIMDKMDKKALLGTPTPTNVTDVTYSTSS
ncbi:hypothetical protein ACEWY4_003039 [Coilia grayii]|uniref:C-C motif chemokine n=1 Tax=Coilia grayii TaxID=363190 RepID=A0ABD1KQ54_9TELE